MFAHDANHYAMRNLCILTQYFPPEMGAPQARLSELGELLIDMGWNVEVLTALPNYPTGRIFAGYPKLRPVVENIGRMRAVRVPVYASTRTIARRLGSYFSFVASAVAFGPWLCRRPDLLLVESPPLIIGYAARTLAALWRCPYVFNVSDLWPDSAIRMGMLRPGFATRQAERLERSLYRNAAGVTGQSNEILAGVEARAPGTRTTLITNGVDPARFGRDKADAAARTLLGSEPGPVFVYAGLLGHAQGLDQVLDLAATLPADVPGRFVLIGDGARRQHLEQRIAHERIARVRIVPAQPRHRVPALLAAADAAIITLAMDIPGSVPSKIYEAMASSLPILIFAEGEAARRVQEPGAGIVVKPGAADDARRAFVQLATDAQLRSQLGMSGRHTAETTYDRRHIAARLDGFLHEITGRESRTGQPARTDSETTGPLADPVTTGAETLI